MLSVEYENAVQAPSGRGRAERAEMPEYSKGMQWQVKDKSAQANLTAFQAVYNIPGRVTIKATNEAKRLHIAADNVEPRLLVRTVPGLRAPPISMRA